MKKIIGYPGCMACGKANPRGLQLDLYFTGGRSRPGSASPGTRRVSPARLRRRAVHPSRRGHGLGRHREHPALLRHRRDERALSRPGGPGDEILARGEIAEDKRRYLVCRGEVLGTDGKVLAKAEGKFFPVTPEMQAEMEERWRRDAAALGHPLP